MAVVLVSPYVIISFEDKTQLRVAFKASYEITFFAALFQGMVKVVHGVYKYIGKYLFQGALANNIIS